MKCMDAVAGPDLEDKHGAGAAKGDGALAGDAVCGGVRKLANGCDGGAHRQDVLLVALPQHTPAHQMVNRPLRHALLCRREQVPCARHQVKTSLHKSNPGSHLPLLDPLDFVVFM